MTADLTPASPLGPCARCGNPTERYGEGGNPLCDRCQDTQPAPDQPI